MTGVVCVPTRRQRIPVQNPRPWSGEQVRIAGSWPSRRGQPVSVALSPSGDRLALSVGQRLSVSPILDATCGEPLLQVGCALAPGLTFSPNGSRLGFRDDDGKGQILDLAGHGPAGEPRLHPLDTTSAMAFSPRGDQLATLAPSLQGRVTVTLRGLQGEKVWDSVLTRNRLPNLGSEGMHLAWSPDGRFLACTLGGSTIWLVAAANGCAQRRFDNHSMTVTGLDWIDDGWLLSASEDATMQLWQVDDASPSTVVETIPAAGMIFVRERSTALIWSADHELLAWSLTDPPTQLWHRNPPTRSVAAHFTRLAVSAVNGLLALVDAGARTPQPLPLPMPMPKFCCSATRGWANLRSAWSWAKNHSAPPSRHTEGGSGYYLGPRNRIHRVTGRC